LASHASIASLGKSISKDGNNPYPRRNAIIKRRLDQICANKDIGVIYLFRNGRYRPIGFLTKHLITARIYNIDVTGKAMLLAKLQRPR
jgi:hypothetical protein